jgi:hypothetical protein
MTQTVIEVTDDEVVIQSTVEQDGESTTGPLVRRPRTEMLSMRGGVATDARRASLQVGDRTLECVLVTREGRRGTLRRWYCPDVPVSGLVRVERNGQVVREVIDWGE